MASADNRVPTRAEVEKQLARMLAGKRLKNAPSQSMLFEYVVEKRLEHIEISEAIIGPALFPDWDKDLSYDVRATAHHLRNTLSKYYAEEGAADPVVITFPRGPRYRPGFAVNSPAARPYARGWHLYAAMTGIHDAGDAVDQFDKAVALDPGYAPAYAARAEVQLSRAPYAHWPSSKELVSAAEASALEALRLRPALWRPHVVLGMVHASRKAWSKAEASFTAALKASREETERHAWYAAYLLATGRQRKALRLVAETAREAPGDPVAQGIHALFLYVTRDFGKAEALLNEVTRVDHWLTDLVLACLGLCTRNSDESWVHAKRAHNRLRGEPFPGLEALCMTKGTRKTQPFRAMRSQQLLTLIEGILPPVPLQLALCYLAVGKPQKAIAELRHARDADEPLMIWAHLWPFFDPLRKHSAFRQLIRQMRFPSPR